MMKVQSKTPFSPLVFELRSSATNYSLWYEILCVRFRNKKTDIHGRVTIQVFSQGGSEYYDRGR